MIVSNIFILTASRKFGESLKRHLESKIMGRVYTIIIPEICGNSEIDLLSCVKAISESINNFPHNVLRKSIAFLDLPFYDPKFERFNIFSDSSINQLASILIFSFPEIHWVFPVFCGESQNEYHFIKWTKIAHFFDKFPKISTPLFDWTNLRNYILKAIRENNEEDAKHIIIRDDNDIAASFDEEEAYAYLHGYIAYKMKFRSFVILTYKGMEDMKEIINRLKLIFEDKFLYYPDKHPKEFWRLGKRGEIFDYLNRVEKKIYVTVGHESKYDKENEEHISFLKSQGKYIKTIYKPCAGIYNILEKANLWQYYWEKKRDEWNNLDYKQMRDIEAGHSVPGKFLLIAQNLIDRAEDILKKAINVVDCIHGATLALIAQELIGYRTPTTSLEAIALKHKLEVKAECMFYGVSYNIDVEKRFREIKKEIEAVGVWFNRKLKKRAIINAKMGVLNEIMNIFKEYGQFDEEQECLIHFRRLNRKWKIMQSGLKGFVAKIFLPINMYIESLLESVTVFVCYLFFWPAIFHLISFLKEAHFKGVVTISDSFFNCLAIFFGMELINEPLDNWAKIISLCLIGLGFIHLGIFISYVYTIITRRD